MRRFPLATVLTLALTTTAFAQSSWTTDSLGRTAIFHLATAPFPHPSRTYKDDRVMFFVPDGYRPSLEVDLIVNYHGHSNEIVNSDKGYHYREQLALSKKNAILLQPQGPLWARDSSGGKHEDPGGLARFCNEALAVLAREGVVPPGAHVRKLLLAGHSGAYEVIGEALAKGGIEVSEVHLNDALYAELDHIEAWATKPGHKLVSAFTRYAGCVVNNAELQRRLEKVTLVGTNDDDATMAGNTAIFVRTDVAHDDVTHTRKRWAAALMQSGLADLGCPRPVMRSVAPVDATRAEVRWYPVRSSVLRGFRIYGSSDGASWTRLADESVFKPANTAAWCQRTATAQFFRVTAVDDLGRESDPSDAYGISQDAAGAKARTLIVDGFARTDGAWTRGDHAFAALLGQSVAASGHAFDTCSAAAIKDGSVALADYPNVLWSAGDQSSTDAALDAREEAALRRYLDQGGALFLSGSELGYYLVRGARTAEDQAFWPSLHATFVADATPSRTARGVAGTALDGVAFDFGGATSPYPVKFPDVIAAASGASVVLRYADGRGAAVSFEGGAARSGVLFLALPVETVEGAGRDALVAKVLAWQDDVSRRAGR